jgi:hypothetical protein
MLAELIIQRIVDVGADPDAPLADYWGGFLDTILEGQDHATSGSLLATMQALTAITVGVVLLTLTYQYLRRIKRA